MTRLVPLSLAFLAIAGCSVSRTHDVPDDGGVVLVERRDDSRSVLYKLYPAAGERPAIHRYETRLVTRPELGVTLADLDEEVALRKGVHRGQGVLVLDVVAGGPAARAGVLRDDVVLAVGGVLLSSAEQAKDHLMRLAEPGRPVALELLRVFSDGASERRAVQVTPEAKQEEITTSESFMLRTLPEVQRFTGLQVAEVPLNLAREIYGVDHPVTLVSGVVIGSPSYLAGLRRGDRILRCDGSDVTTSDAVLRSLSARLRPDTEGEDPDDRPIEFQVTGALGPHRTGVEVTFELDESTRFYIPILFEYAADVTTTRWSFLDFIFQFGANYASTYLRAPTRRPAAETELSMLPLGMFEFERSPSMTRYTLFWLISWTASR